MKKVYTLCFFAIGIAGTLAALPPPPAPEIDPASGANALALLSGAVLMFRSRRKR